MDVLNKKEVYKCFNNGIKTFIRAMISTYPEIPEFKLMHLFYKMSKTMSYKRPQRLFNAMIAVPHAQHIIDDNLDALLKDEYALDVDSMFMNSLKTIYVEKMDQVNRRVIRDHLLCLLALNKKCVEIEAS
jgi:hypothetical protein